MSIAIYDILRNNHNITNKSGNKNTSGGSWHNFVEWEEIQQLCLYVQVWYIVLSISCDDFIGSIKLHWGSNEWP